MPFSVLILTHNEASNISPCISSLLHNNPTDLPFDIAVLDSGSTDDTASIAQSLGARIFSRPFDNFANQRNWGVKNIVWKYDWILHLDSDERANVALVKEIVAETHNSCRDAYFIANRLIFMGRWIRRSSQYPRYQARLLHRERAHFVSRGHGQYLPEGHVNHGYLRTPYDHLNFSKGIADWVDKHNRYSSDEAVHSTQKTPSFLKAFKQLITARSPSSHQVALKEIGASLPFRPLARFIYLYFLRLGFMDGRAGLDYCMLTAGYQYLIELKRREARSGGDTQFTDARTLQIY